MKKSSLLNAALLLLILFFGAVSPLPAHDMPDAGFYTLEETSFYFHTNSYFNRLALRSSPARIWYVYQPAEEEPAAKPLFVFFNGGPGGATSAGLLSAFTGHNAVSVNPDSGESSVVKNPSSWTRIGNLLHIDARTTGFSYSLMDNPQDNTLRRIEFDCQNYNCFFDGAEFVRVLLRFLADHPALQQNPVVIVGESYGGIRSSAMLHLLLYYQDYGSGQAIYQDPSLVQEIQRHYDVVFPAFSGQTVPPRTIAGQFGHQVLIQPAVAHPYQKQVAAEMLEAPGSVMDELALETGVPFIRWANQPHYPGYSIPSQVLNNVYNYLEAIDRDAYIISKPDQFFWEYFSGAAALLTQYDSLNRMIRKDSADIPELYAQARNNGYKFNSYEDPFGAERVFSVLGPEPKAEVVLNMYDASQDLGLVPVFGSLQPWDRYFVDLNYDANAAFPLSRLTFYQYDAHYSSSDRFGRMFLQNVAWVNTFITNAAYDLVVYAPSLPGALGLHTETLTSSQHDAAGPGEAERPGQILLQYRPSVVPGSNVQSRAIRFPYYADSGHAVTMTEPAEILADVIEWLDRSGLPVVETVPDTGTDAAQEASFKRVSGTSGEFATGRIIKSRGGKR